MAAIDKIYCTYKEWKEIFEPEVERLDPIFKEFFHTKCDLKEFINWSYDNDANGEKLPISNLPTKLDKFIAEQSDIFCEKLISWNYNGFDTKEELRDYFKKTEWREFPTLKPKVKCIELMPFTSDVYFIEYVEDDNYVHLEETNPPYWEYWSGPYFYKKIGNGWSTSTWFVRFNSKEAMIRRFRNSYPVPGEYTVKDMDWNVRFKFIVK
ncbi:MAG: hypothetical protein HUJ56_01850 [Erysipelotrichaceae bacterium]|nr:hypothetical protein [Erysipelotrichaceae bacterium]